MTITALVREIVADELAVDPIIVTKGAGFVDDLGADSLDLVELTMRLEEEFAIEISDEDAANLTTVGSVVEYIKSVVDPSVIKTKGKLATGGVYMLAAKFPHTTYYKIGKAIDFERRIHQIKLQLPFAVEEVHRIHTADPYKVESYWHQQFAHCRRNGEWFELTKKEVSEFKRQTKI